MRIDNLRDNQAVRTRKIVKTHATSANLGDTSITTLGKRLRVGAPGEGGYLEAGGRLFWQGPVELIGEVLLDGNVRITLTLTVDAETELNGDVELNSDLTVAGGRVVVQGPIELVIDDGKLQFANGASVAGTAGGVTVASGGGAQLQVASTVASISSGTNSIRTEGTGNVVNGTTDFQGDVLLNNPTFAEGLPTVPLSGVPSGTLVRNPVTKEIYVAL